MWRGRAGMECPSTVQKIRTLPACIDGVVTLANLVKQVYLMRKVFHSQYISRCSPRNCKPAIKGSSEPAINSKLRIEGWSWSTARFEAIHNGKLFFPKICPLSKEAIKANPKISMEERSCRAFYHLFIASMWIPFPMFLPSLDKFSIVPVVFDLIEKTSIIWRSVCQGFWSLSSLSFRHISKGSTLILSQPGP